MSAAVVEPNKAQKQSSSAPKPKSSPDDDRREHGLPVDGFEWHALTPAPDDALTFEELSAWVRFLKRKLKRGPRLSRKERVEYLRRLAPDVVEKLRSELDRLAETKSLPAQTLVKRMRERYPELDR